MFEEFTGENPGIAFAVLREGEVVLRECHGLAELETRTPVTPSTNFRIASVTKPFIAEAIAILLARGVLRYEDEVFDGATVQQLLTHTSGIADYEDLIPPERTEQVRDEDVVRLLAGTHRQRDGVFRYSNSGYVLLGLLIERVSGRALEDFLHDEIFAKHAMHTTTLGPPSSNRAYGYDRDGDRWVRRDQSITSATRGDGGIYSNIDDLARWVGGLEEGVPFVDVGEPGLRYGRGWFYRSGGWQSAVGSGQEAAAHHDDACAGAPANCKLPTANPAATIEHYGDTVSFRSAIIRWPARKLGVIVLMNRNEFDALVAARQICEYYL